MTLKEMTISDSLQIGNVTITVRRGKSGSINLVIDGPSHTRIVPAEAEGNLNLQQHRALLAADL